MNQDSLISIRDNYKLFNELNIKIKVELEMKHLKQTLMGIALIVLTIIMMFLDKDVTASIITIPMGLYCIFSKNDIFKEES